MPPFMQVLAIGRAQHRPAARRKHPVRLQGQFAYHRFLDIAEADLPFPFEVVPNGTAEPLLDDMVGVEKGQL